MNFYTRSRILKLFSFGITMRYVLAFLSKYTHFLNKELRSGLSTENFF